jgi:hypothetical protein
MVHVHKVAHQKSYTACRDKSALLLVADGQRP